MGQEVLARLDGAQHTFTVAEEGQRLDLYLVERLPGLSRTALQRLIKDGHVRHNGHPGRAGVRLEAGDLLQVTAPPPTPPELTPQSMDLRILYEDDALLVVDKPAGLTVHPAPGHPDRTLVNALLARGQGLSTLGGSERPGIVHRLDKDTSGLVLIAKDDPAHRELARQFAERETEKAYIALVRGHPRPPEGVLEGPIGRDPRRRQRMAIVEGGREARTAYRVLAAFPGYSLVEARPETGRTHQVRVHLAAAGHPVAGDARYGGRSPLVGRQFLHARRLSFRHPRTGERVTFTSPLPADLAEALRELAASEPGTLDTLRWLLVE